MRTPVVLITGVDPEPMAAVAVGLQWDLPNAVVVRHHIDVERQVLQRVVSDVSGVVEREEIELEHACVSCAIREDVVPTIERCARDGRWKTVLAHLPVGAEAGQVCAVMAWDTRLARHVRVASVVTALAGEDLVEDLLGDALLYERGRHSSEEDARGVGEVACGMVEYADVVVVSAPGSTTGLDLVRTLARPDATVVAGSEFVEAAHVVGSLHDHTRTSAWTSPLATPELSATPSGIWRLELSSPRAFHPDRLLADLERLGAGRHRSRGCFWLPTRPDRAVVWDGAGGQLSIGTGEPWGRRTPLTRLVLVGVGTPPAHLGAAFEQLLVRPGEALLDGRSRHVAEDGFEPWLGEIRGVA
jgi:G3E family GTPase